MIHNSVSCNHPQIWVKYISIELSINCVECIYKIEKHPECFKCLILIIFTLTMSVSLPSLILAVDKMSLNIANKFVIAKVGDKSLGGASTLTNLLSTWFCNVAKNDFSEFSCSSCKVSCINPLLTIYGGWSINFFK